MSTTITKALREAKASLPLNQRVWMWLYEHPGHTCPEIALGINADKGDVSSVMSQMAVRKMVVKTTDFTQQPGHRAGKVWRYATSPKMKTYKLLPPAPKEVATPAPSGFIERGVDRRKAEQSGSLLDTLPVPKAFALYKELRTVFGATAA